MALIKYFDLVDGAYVENPDGLLLGITWDDVNGNSLRAVLFFMNYQPLQFGHEIPFYYQTEMKPEGSSEWLLQARKEFKISNDIIVDGTVANLHENLRRRTALEVPPEPGIGQLDFFINLYYKGEPVGELEPIYHWLADVLADLEGQTIETAYEFLPLTLQVVAFLQTLGVFLTLQQQIDLDLQLRATPFASASAAQKSVKGFKTAADLPAPVLKFLKAEGISLKN
jgi:hypothetical protein